VAANLGLNDISRGNAYVTVESAAKARAAREVEAKRVNPEFNDTLSDFTTLGTAGLYLATLWDFDAKAAPKLWVKAFFGEFCFLVLMDDVHVLMLRRGGSDCV